MLSKLILSAFTLFLLTTPISAQSWNSSQAGSSISFTSILANGTYTWTVTNLSNSPQSNTPGYDLLAWTLQPFNIIEPSSVESPDGWTWISSNGNSRFEIDDMKDKYIANGPALEPGESLIFRYTPTAIGNLVNKGGPSDGKLAFITHIGSVDPMSSPAERWEPSDILKGQTWHEVVYDSANGSSTVPEPAGWVAMLMGISSTFGVMVRRGKQARIRAC